MSNKYKLLESYVLLEKFASGGMADIYLAKKNNTEIQKFVSIKKVLHPYVSHNDFNKLFKEEIRVSIGLHHSNIVSCLDYVVVKEQVFLVMEYINGVNLRQFLNDLGNFKKKLEVPFALHLASQIAAGLDYVHKKTDDVTGTALNIIHRDINPTNLMISFDGEVKVIDFGIARSNQKLDKTKSGMIVGKMSYLSPEQVQEQNIDSRSDIFSLGAVLWEIFSGKKLFQGESDFATLNAIVFAEIPKLNSLDASFPEQLDLILAKALSRDIEKRYQSMSEFKYDLDRFLFTHYSEFRKEQFFKYISEFYAVAISERREKLTKYRNAKFEPRDNKTKESKAVVEEPKAVPTSKDPKYIQFAPVNRYDSTQYTAAPSLAHKETELPEGFESSKPVVVNEEHPKFDRLKPEQLFSQPVSTYTKPKTGQFFAHKKLEDSDSAESNNTESTLFSFVPYWLRPSNYTHLAMIFITIYALHSFMKENEFNETVADKTKSIFSLSRGMSSVAKNESGDESTAENPIALVTEVTGQRVDTVNQMMGEALPAQQPKVPVYNFEKFSTTKKRPKPIAKKIEFGYINLFIDKYDKSNMSLSVNGKELTGHPPFYNLKMPANQKVAIVVQLKKTKKNVYRSIMLAPNSTQIVRIRPDEESQNLASPYRKITSDK